MTRPILTVFWLALCIFANSPEAWGQYRGIDVLHYHFQLELSDTTDAIIGKAEIDLTATRDRANIQLDLENALPPSGDGEGAPKGMQVGSVDWNGAPATWTHRDRVLTIHQPISPNDTGKLTIYYRGIPSDGLIISKNKYGNRTFFSDHWPNRGSCYLPLNDHPTDKATSSFEVMAPSAYRVVSNGQLLEEPLPTSGHASMDRTWSYSMQHEIPTKVMVIGVAAFDTASYAPVGTIPLRGWVFPEDAQGGHTEYAAASEILAFFDSIIAPYPFHKLDQVQSKTIFGGMENAGCIFYHEGSTVGDGSSEDLIAHEIAHQWYGNSASESDWNHLWLSEGFATFLTGFYLEKKYGFDAYYAYMDAARNRVMQFAQRYPRAVVVPDSTPDLMALLNPYSYQKGAWILHMARREMGEDAFLQGIRSYYQQYQFSNAHTSDLLSHLNNAFPGDLSPLFEHYLYHPEIPEIAIASRKNRTLSVHLAGLKSDLILSEVSYRCDYIDKGHREEDAPSPQYYEGQTALSAAPTLLNFPKNVDISSIRWNIDGAYLLK